MNNRNAIQQIIDAENLERSKPPLFLAAWKEAVLVAGTNYFHLDCEYVATATEVNQLRPDIRLIFDSINVMSTHERTFMLCLCQFYCDSDTRALCTKIEVPVPSLADVASVDNQCREIIVRLIQNYTGW